MSRIPRIGLILLATCFLVVGLVFAQAAARGVLEGVVQDDQGKPVAEATVTVEGPQGVRTAVTDRNGRYQFRDLVPAKYTVKAEKSGLSTLVQTEVEIFLGKRTQLPFLLSVGKVETVTVTSQAPVVDMKSTTVGAVVSTEDLVQHIPLGRGFATMFTLSPGVTSGLQSGAGNFSVSGSSGLENAYLIDGVNITNSGYGGIGSYNRVFGSLGSGVTNDFIEQVEIKEGGFEAEFGVATGGVMNAVVKSGTNDLTGEVSAYLTPDSWESTRRELVLNPDSISVVETDQQDFSANLGGPIVRDKLFWYAAYNPVKTETTFQRLVEDDSVLFDALGNPIDPAQQTGGRIEVRERTNDNYAAKVSWYMTPNHRVELTAFGDPSDGELGPQRSTSLRRLGTEGFSELEYGGNNYSFKYFGAVRPNLFIDAMYAFHESELVETAQPLYSVFDIDRNIATGGLGFAPLTDEEVDQVSLKATYVIGNHEIKVGYQEDTIDYIEAGTQTGPTWTANLPIGQMMQFDPDGVPGSGDEYMDWGWTGATFDFESTTGAFVEQSILSDPDGIPNTGDELYEFATQRSRHSPVQVLTKNEEKNAFVSWTYTPIPQVTIKAGARWTEEFVAGGEPFELPFAIVRNSGDLADGMTDSGASVTRLVDLSRTTAFDPTALTFPDEIAPRVGVTWDINNDGKNKLYANYGLYIQRMTQDLAFRAFSNEVDLRQAWEDTVPRNVIDGNLTTPHITMGGCPDPASAYDAGADGIVGTADDGGWDNSDCQIITAAAGLGGPSVVASGTELPRTEEMLLGYSMEINPTMAIDFRYIHREIDTVIEDFAETPQEAINNLLWGSGLGFAFDPYPQYPVASFGNYVLANPAQNTVDAIAELDAQGAIDSTIAQQWLDGTIPDFPDPERNYDALEVVLNKRYSDNWVLWASYRYARLNGNYEGLLRNDNGQDDPNITSLYDFPNTPLMSGQFLSGPLNTEVEHNLKAFGSYTFPFGFTVGGGLSWSTGVPRFTQLIHPNDFYQLPANGEVPGIDPVYGQWMNRIDVATGVDVGFDGIAGNADDGMEFLTLFEGINGTPNLVSTGQLDMNGDLIFNNYLTPDPVTDGYVDQVLPGLVENQFLYSYTPIKRDNNGRTPDNIALDLHFGYDIDVGRGMTVKLLLDVFNVFNSQPTLNFDDVLELQQGRPNPNFGRPALFQPYQGPREFRFAARFAF